MAAVFRLSGHEVVESPKGADLVIINSCAVTAAAASDSRSKVRAAYRAGVQQIALTGCWATVAPDEARNLPGVTQVYENDEKENIPARILGQAISLYDLEPLERKPLPGAHRRTRAFIKVQDGCDNFCTFCITRVARGKSRSLTKDEILADVQRAEKGGTHEAVLSGVNLGAWGRDLGDNESLSDLIEYILQNSRIERLRLSSIEPWDMDERFLELWQERRMCRHMHIPLQSGCKETLTRMGRRTNPEQYKHLVEQIRRRMPDMAITTDVIVGFAGEDNTEFAESLAFVREMNFAGGHVFRFSPREGTPAWNLPGRVNGKMAHQRSEAMRQVLRESELGYWGNFLGQPARVIWESSKRIGDGCWKLHGLADNYLPVTTVSDGDRWNEFDLVVLTAIEDEFIAARFL
jgi:threonylcarbamoyladenosine tRNA methylthiotransferase MtaB